MVCQLFLDTNAMLNLGEKAFNEHFVIAQKTLEEIENIKTSSSKDNEVKHKARIVARLLDKYINDYTVVPYSSVIKEIIDEHYLSETPDNVILSSAYYYNKNINSIVVCSDDLNCKFISRNIFNLPTKGTNDINIIKDLEEYHGFKDITFTDEEMSYFYCHLKDNFLDCLLNEYLIIRKSDGEIVDYRHWDGNEYKSLSYKQVNSPHMGKIKPRNEHQILAFDLLQDKNKTIKVISGRMGSGKDFIMIANALKLIEEGRFDKLIYIRNAIGVKDANEIGYLPGTALEKLKPFAMPLADHLGGEIGLDMQLMQGTIEIEHLGHIRGRDFKNCIVYCSEAENLTREHVQLLIGRIGEGSVLWINGDFKQTDSPLYRMNNGLLSAVIKLAGHEKFGYVQLQKTERSETAAMADLLD